MKRSLPWLLSAALTACAVSGPGTSPDPEDGVVVPDGKEDDFYSLSAYEWVLEGRTTVTLEPELAGASAEARDARVRELIGYKQIAIAWFLTQYLVDKEHDDPNAGFGGFGGLAKAGAYEDMDVRAVDELTYEFRFRQIVAGKKTLDRALPLRIEGATRVFDLEIGKPTNEELAQLETNNEWYRSAPWSGWNPANVPAERKETITFSVERERSSSDAWFDYESMLADGVLAIDVHFGWDYHSEYHIKHARALFSWLKGRGFQAPVDDFDDLQRDSGPLTKTIDADGREIEVRVGIFYGKPGSATDPDTDAGGRALEEDVRASLASADAIVYSGHSGPFYGFALANWRTTAEGDFDDSEMSTAAMPAERYQIVFAEGCDTYHIGEAFRRNPAKPDGRFIDIITTTSFSNASTPAAVQDFIGRLIELDSLGRHRPRTLKSLLSDLDGNSYYFHTMYGIHGIDDNPALHPYADLEMTCQACDSNADCGGPGNLCVTVGGARSCVAACTDDRGCPDGFACRAIASQSTGTVYASACVPANNACE